MGLDDTKKSFNGGPVSLLRDWVEGSNPALALVKSTISEEGKRKPYSLKQDFRLVSDFCWADLGKLCSYNYSQIYIVHSEKEKLSELTGPVTLNGA